jgi:hypothetical protein
MIEIGYALSAEEHPPGDFVRYAVAAEEAGFSEQVAETIICGPDVDRHREAIDEFEQAGFDHVYVHQVGLDQDSFFRFYEREVLTGAAVR